MCEVANGAMEMFSAMSINTQDQFRTNNKVMNGGQLNMKFDFTIHFGDATSK